MNYQAATSNTMKTITGADLVPLLKLARAV
jgi:hypothetical protein